MDNVSTKLPSQDSATGRGIKTAVQAIIGAAIVFALGLWGAINNVPGCSGAVLQYVTDNVAQLIGTFGISTGLVSFVWNLLRKDIPNY